MAHEPARRHRVMAERFDALGVAGVHPVESQLCDITPTRARAGMVRVDTKADGHCGAYVLAVVVCAVTGEALSARSIRGMIYARGVSLSKEASASAAEQRTFSSHFRAVASRTYLHQNELVLLLHHFGLNVCILVAATTPEAHPVLLCYAAVGAADWAFLRFSHGCHWELYARECGGGILPVWSDKRMRAILVGMRRRGVVVSDESAPSTSYFGRVDAVPAFAIDFADRIWIRSAPRRRPRGAPTSLPSRLARTAAVVEANDTRT